MPTATWNGSFRGEGSGGSAGSFITRPLCPFPKEAVYDGAGAANFACKVVK